MIKSPMVKCGACEFWVSGNAHNGLCQHLAPRPTESPNAIAYWPETLEGDTCGEGRPRSELSPIVPCGSCVFWQSSSAVTGVYPVDRLGAPTGWWREAGHCVRYAPGPSSDPGQRGFWRVTHQTDGCAQGLPHAAGDAVPKAPPPG